MRIDIVNQTNEQECGVCVLTSLHNYYYKHNIIEKQQILDESKINIDGMSIFDFEVCANKLGLECESYEIMWSEFINLKINSYFVLLLSTTDNQTNHYVIAKKNKSHIYIYDSSYSKANKFKYSEIQNKFLNVLILVNKKPNKIFSGTFSKAKSLLMFDLKFVLLNILLSILILASSIGCASFLNWIIDISINNNSIRNLLTISFIFIFIFFTNNLISHVNNLYCSGHLKSYFLLFTSKILSSLKNKKSTFLNKVDKNWIYKVDECVFNISNFCIVEVNKFISNLLFIAISVCVICVMQWQLLAFVLIIPLIQLIFFFFSYRKKKNIFINIVRSENKNTDNYKKLISSLSNELWNSKKDNLINEIKSNYSIIYKNFNDVTLFKGNINLFKSLLKSLVEIILIATMAYLIIKNKSLTVGKLTFILSTFGLYASSTDQIFTYFLSKIEFNVYWQVYKDLTEVDNLNQNKLISTQEEINSISFFYENKKVILESKKDNLLNLSALNLLSNSVSFYINNQKVDINNSNVINNIIVCDENSKFNFDFFMSIFEKEPQKYAKYLRYFEINLNSINQPFYKKTILNLLCLTNESKKIIILDSILDYLPLKDKLMIKDIVNKIQKNNYVFVIRKEEND